MSNRTPKMSIGSWAFSFGPYENNPWPFDDVLAFAKRAGFDGVEINGFRPHPHPDDFDTQQKCHDLLARIDGHGLGISGYAPSFEDVPPAQVDREIYLAEIRKSIRLCNWCNIDLLRVDTMDPPAELDTATYAARFSRIAETWRAAADECGDHGITLVWEFEPGFWLNKPSEVRRLYEAVGSEYFKILFDTSHAYMSGVIGARQPGEIETLQGGVAEFAELLGDSIGHLHLIDSDGTLHDDATSTHAPFGRGRVDFAGALAPIRDIVGEMEWWTADYCFWPATEVDALEAPDYMRRIAAEVLS